MTRPGKIALTDRQLQIVHLAATNVPYEKRSQFLERIAAMLRLRGRGHFTDSDVGDAVKLALTGLAHQRAA